MNQIILNLYDEKENYIGDTFSLIIPKIGESIILENKKLFKVKNVIHYNDIGRSQYRTHVNLYLEYIKDIN